MNVSYKKSVHLKFSPLCNILPVDICETPHSQLPCVSMDGWHMNFSRTSLSRLTEVLGTCVVHKFAKGSYIAFLPTVTSSYETKREYHFFNDFNIDGDRG